VAWNSTAAVRGHRFDPDCGDDELVEIVDEELFAWLKPPIWTRQHLMRRWTNWSNRSPIDTRPASSRQRTAGRDKRRTLEMLRSDLTSVQPQKSASGA
jgi:hypothetical protein